jgi:dolichol kinase
MYDYSVAIVSIVVGLVACEVLAYVTKIPKSVLRKFTHIAMSLIVIFIGLLINYSIFVPLGIIFGIGMLLLRFVFPLRSLSDRANNSYGEVLFPIGVGLAAFIVNDVHQFVICILILGFADTAAYIAGRHLKSRMIVFDKTVAGSTAFFITCLVILLFMTPLSLVAISIASALTICEIISPWGGDNFTLPVVSALLLVFFA